MTLAHAFIMNLFLTVSMVGLMVLSIVFVVWTVAWVGDKLGDHAGGLTMFFWVCVFIAALITFVP